MSNENAMPEVTTSDGKTVVLGDISAYDKVILMKVETDYGVGYHACTEVEDTPGAYYQHYAGKMIGKSSPDCEINALMDAQMWAYSRNPNCTVVVR